MAANFSGVTPTWVEPLEPEFKNLITQGIGAKQYQNLDPTGILKYKLRWEEMSNANFWTLYNHYYSCKGGFDSFSWKSVPSYIDTDQDSVEDGTDLTGRWVEGTFKFSANAKSWNAEIVFEKA